MAKGASGTYRATATISQMGTTLVAGLSATAGGNVDGTSVAKASAGIGGNAPAFATSSQATALAMGAPAAASTAAVLNANAKIKAAFGASPVFFALGELGGGFSRGGTASQTATSEIDESVDLTKLASRQDLVVGFDHGTTLGAGVTGVSFDLYADGTDVLSKTFTSASAARTWFTDNAVDLGSLASGQPLGADTLTLRAVLTVTSNTAGSGFYGDIIVGDPPSAPHASAAPARFVDAMASLGATPWNSTETTAAFVRLGHPLLAHP